MKRFDYPIFLLAVLLLLSGVVLRSGVGAEARWLPALLLFGFNFLTIGLVRYRRRQDHPESNCS
ncbi:hypothetical protein [Hymenobacter rubripertinctus]|uniref:Uncharacterized protein n=1 Tax=Hymenobacter rubripertinctus TaxID=2029981 RepID=A0A418QK29_9BACT|nr:hypothetical protein [Hymenobacter rubripertinctus]RIY05576.1 hypothetical protein D0T11_20205 [Hymenobacter rubripertinctus]